MGVEIERKFLVLNEDWRLLASESHVIRQGYLSETENRLIVRVRIVNDNAAYLTLKSHQQGPRRDEFEYAIPLDDARSLLLAATGSVVGKRRHIVVLGQTRWEIDEFDGANSGLVVAEVELASERSEFERPSWLGQEVTSDIRYGNAALAHRPFTTW